MDTIWVPDLTNFEGPKYRALETAIVDAIRVGDLKSGEKLPPVREMGWQLGITPGTVARAYKNLVDTGSLVAGVGRGTFVPESNVPEVDTILMYDMVQYDGAKLLSPRMPDKGQAKLLREGFTHFAENATTEMLLHYPDRELQMPAITAFAQAARNWPIGAFDHDDIVMTHGGQHAVLLILQTILKGANPVIAVDELSYAGFRKAAELCRAKVVGIPSDNEGPDPEALENAYRNHGIQIYCTSADVINPTAKITSVRRRGEIAAIAERYGFHILDDDCYRNGPHMGPSYRQLLPELAWYSTSPSKSTTAGLRIGMVVCPKIWSHAAARAAVFSSFGVSHAISHAYWYLQSHPTLPKILEESRAHLADYQREAVNRLGKFEINWVPNVPFIWLTLPNGWRSGEFCRAAEDKGIGIKSAEEFAQRDAVTPHAVRIAMNGQMSKQAFRKAMDQLAYLLEHPPEQLTV